MHRPSFDDAEAAAGLPELQGFCVANRPRLKRLLTSARVPPADAEDLLQETMLVLVHRWDQMDGVVSREGWLIGTLRRKILQYWRRRARERRILEEIDAELEGCETAPQERRDSARDVRSICAGLPFKARKVLWLRYGLELAPREAARSLGCRPDSVRRLARRALERARKRLASGAPDG